MKSGAAPPAAAMIPGPFPLSCPGLYAPFPLNKRFRRAAARPAFQPGTAPPLPRGAPSPSKSGDMTATTGKADRPTALVASPTEAAQAAEALLRERYAFVPLAEAD